MDARLYGLGRLVFGAAVLAAPETIGRTLLGDDAALLARG